MKSGTFGNAFAVRVFLAVMLGLGLASLPLQVTRAATCLVTSNADSGSGSLREAIGDSPCTTIDFNGDTTILLSSTLTLARDVTIDGGTYSVTISGQNAYRVFLVNSGVTAELDHLTITQGVETFGGGLFNAGTLTLKDSTFVSNTGSWGGAIWSQGVMTVADSTFVSNHTPGGDGAGINNRGSLTLTGSVFTGNQAGYYGGALYDNLSTAIVSNNTFTGNQASIGGAVYNHHYSNLTLLNDTFSGNGSSSGGDLANDDSSTFNFSNTILVNSYDGGDCVNSALLGTHTDNWVQDGSCSANWSGSLALGTLQDNGGPTRTMALPTGSPAIDAGDAATCATAGQVDQRGVTRPQGAACDLGALEVDTTAPTIVSFTRHDPVDAITSATSLVFRVTFSENVQNVDIGDFNVNGATTARVTGIVEVDDRTYDLTISGGNLATFTGVVGLDLAAGQNITDRALNPLPAGDPAIDETYQMNHTPHAVPGTGFAPDGMTLLPPRTISYADLGDLWLEIPRLGVKMPIVGVPQSADGTWDVSWLGTNAGWLNGSAFPTWNGNSVLTGHVYDAYGQPGPFRYLNTLWWGDLVIVHSGRAQYVYEVRSILQVAPANTAAMLKHEELPWVTLVTCRGYDEASNSYKYRVLVRAALAEVK